MRAFLPYPKEIPAKALLVIHLGFLLTGTLTTLLGPLLPALSQRWSLDDAQSGYLFTAQFTGSIIGVLLSSRVIARLGLLKALAISFVFMAAGTATLAVVPFAGGLIAVGIYGSGLGVAIPTSNMLLVELDPAKRAESLNLLNLVWGAGAVLTPPLVGPLGLRFGTLVPLALLSGLLAAVSLSLSLFLVEPMKGKGPVEDRTAHSAAPWRSPALLLIAIAAFLYVGAENSLSGWLASYSLRSEATHSFWAFTLSLFWLAILVGRGVSPLVLHWLAPLKLIIVGIAIAIVGLALLVLWRTAISVVVGTTLAGLGFAPVFPTTIAVLGDLFGSLAKRVAGLVFGLAAFGGATIPWLVGIISKEYGDLRAGLFVPLCVAFLMLLIQIGLVMTTLRPRQGSGCEG